MAYLLANNGPSSGTKFALESDCSYLGRHPDCHIVVDVGAVSRKHCVITRDGVQFLIDDLESRNGTFVNGELIVPKSPRELAAGDKVKVCDVSFTFYQSLEQQEELQRSERVFGDRATISATVSDSRVNRIFFEETAENNSTIMSKLDVSGDSHRAQVTSTPQVKLKALIDIASSLSKTIALDEVLPKVLDSLFQIFLQADRGFIVLLSESGDLIPMWTKVRREDSTQSFRVSRTIIKQVLDSRQAILSADAASDERFDLSQSVAEFRIRSMMCAPLLDGEGNPIGALQVDTLNQSKRFQTEDLEVLAMIALQAGIAIDNAQLHEQALQQREIERDLELAQQMQSGFLPEQPPNVQGYRFHSFYHPAHHVGGDYFDYVELADGRVAIVIADVVGHGVAAALLMAKFSAEFRFSVASEKSVADAMKRLNRAVARLQLNRFVTMILIVLEPDSGQLTLAIAGHAPPLIRRSSGEVESIGGDVANIPLGIEEEVDYEQASSIIAPGELLVVWTDGINEAMNEHYEQLGIARLIEILGETDSIDPALVGQRFVQAARQFQVETHEVDDMCLVAFSREPKI